MIFCSVASYLLARYPWSIAVVVGWSRRQRVVGKWAKAVTVTTRTKKHCGAQHVSDTGGFRSDVLALTTELYDSRNACTIPSFAPAVDAGMVTQNAKLSEPRIIIIDPISIRLSISCSNDCSFVFGARNHRTWIADIQNNIFPWRDSTQGFTSSAIKSKIKCELH